MKKSLFFILLFFTFQCCLAHEITYSKEEIQKLIKKGNQYFSEADFINSLKTLKIALVQAEHAKQYSLAAKASSRIGRNFEEISEIENALFFLYKALAYAEKANDDDMRTSVYINLGNILTFNPNLDFNKGIAFHKKALVQSLKVKDFQTAVTININLAWTYFNLNKFDVGYQYLVYLNENFEKYGEKQFYISMQMLNGLYYSYLNENKKAQMYFLLGINHNSDLEAVLREEKQDLYFAYSEFLFKIGDYKNAYINLNKYNEISKKLFDQKKLITANLSGLNLLVDNYKKDLTISESENKTQLDKLRLTREVMFLLAALIIALTVLLFGLFFSYQKNIKASNNLKENNEKLKIAIDKAEEANILKTQFVSTISHELRTPLYGVIGITDLICREYKQIIDSKPLEALQFSARYLLALINDVLQVSKIESENMVLDNKIFNLHKEVNSIKNALDIIATNKLVALQIRIDKNVPEYILGDQIRLSQVLMNLLSNALKFTKIGTVTLSMRTIKVVDDIYHIKFTVNDTGIGISPENQIKIFDRFTQINSDEENYQGTGLGLTIVKKIIALFQSEIELESMINIGSTFSFTVGLAKVENKPNIIDAQDFKSLNGVKVLIVEDNKINQLVSKKIIEQKQMLCKVVSSGQEAIDILKTEIFDIILMDVNMPGINGFETSKIIKSLNINIPIVVLTACNKSQISAEATAAGIADVIEKPFDPFQLYNIILEHIIP